MALQTMLDSAWQKRDLLNSLCDTKVSLKRHIAQFADKDLLKRLNQFQVQPFKDSLKIEFISLVESYMKRLQKDEKAQFPRVTISHEEMCKNLNDASYSLKYLSRLYDKLEAHNTIYFCRYSDCRDYSLLYDPAKRKFYAKLYLLSQKDSLKHMPHKNAETPLVIVGKNEALPTSHKPERFILLGLSFGKLQEKLLTEALERPEMLKTARLIKKGSDYYLAINLAVEPVASVKTRSFAGFHISEEGVMRFHVCDQKGEIKDQGSLYFEKGAPLPEEQDKLHIMANQIVSLCAKHQAQAVLESYPLYNRLSDILSYKLPLKGLKKPIRVSPFGLWTTCPRCGYNGRKNSGLKTVFLCAACGFGIENQLIPSYNLAKRLIHYHSSKICFNLIVEGRRKIIKNTLLNIEFVIGPGQGIDNFLDHIRARTEAIKDYLENRETDWTKEDKRLYSLWNKLLSTDDIRSVIEIEQ